MADTVTTPTGPDSTAASELLRGLIALLGEARTRYLFTRNFEGYPETLTGDVDVFTGRAEFEGIRARFETLVRRQGWGVFRALRRPWLASYQLVKPDLPATARRILVVEFFFGFTWRGLEYLDLAEVWARRILHRGFPATDRLDSALTTVLHYFFWSGYVPRKYVPLVAACLEAGQREEMRRRLLRGFPPPLANRLLAEFTGLVALPEEGWQTRLNVFAQIHVFPGDLRRACRRHLLRRALRKSPWGLARLVFGLAAGAAGDVCRLGGTVLILSGGNSEEQAVEILREAKAFHLYKNSASQVCALNDLRVARRAVWRTLWEGGLAILPVADDARVARHAVRFVPAGRVFHVTREAPKPGAAALPGAPLVAPGPGASPHTVLMALVAADQRE